MLSYTQFIHKDRSNLNPILIIGGGLAGLTASILLKRAGFEVILIEKKKYPFHRVCGEYISNEVLDFLKQENLLPLEPALPQINWFELSSISGKSIRLPLDLGGFGVSRYTFDQHLVSIARKEGVDVQEGTQVQSISFNQHLNEFSVELSNGEAINAQWVIGSYGKRSKLDKSLKRPFFYKRSPYIGVKYHVKVDHPENQVSLHNFRGGYCGLNHVENGTVNLCYLSHRDNLKAYGDIRKMEKEVLYRNKHLKKIFAEAEFLFKQPEVINEISFETKGPVENHVLMCGDAAGMITPLCGNGMAMAIHGAKILADHFIEARSKNWSRIQLEEYYSHAWNSHFKTRLSIGRSFQRLFGNGLFSGLTVDLLKIKPLARKLVASTHGKPVAVNTLL